MQNVDSIEASKREAEKMRIKGNEVTAKMEQDRRILKVKDVDEDGTLRWILWKSFGLNLINPLKV